MTTLRSLDDAARPTLLVLGGSGYARRWTDALVARLEELRQEKVLAVRIVYALAGATRSPRLPRAPAEVRSGGFGGAAGLQGWLQENRAVAVVDGTHPFAERISENARQAARASSLPLFRLQPSPLPRLHARRRFQAASSQHLQSLVASLPASYRRCVLCALGAQRIVPLVRALPAQSVYLRSFASYQRQRALRLQQLRLRRVRTLRFAAMPALSAQSVWREMRGMRQMGVSLLLCRDSGAREAFVKILAARKLSLPVVMLSRPRERGSNNFSNNLSCELSPAEISPVVRLLQERMLS